jgi:hypothetical protein
MGPMHAIVMGSCGKCMLVTMQQQTTEQIDHEAMLERKDVSGRFKARKQQTAPSHPRTAPITSVAPTASTFLQVAGASTVPVVYMRLCCVDPSLPAQAACLLQAFLGADIC